mmetsp:Transcript_27484/g.49735  ORF Transcript_27484/g.49735 Transcript_27484/m.49735 type:complete len:109 (-) Transcript_27484:1022-1348(-)
MLWGRSSSAVRKCPTEAEAISPKLSKVDSDERRQISSANRALATGAVNALFFAVCAEDQMPAKDSSKVGFRVLTYAAEADCMLCLFSFSCFFSKLSGQRLFFRLFTLA